MEEANVKYKSSSYVYGNVAYDLEPEATPKVKKSTEVKKVKQTSKFRLVCKIFAVFVLSFFLVYRFAIILELTYDIRNIKSEISRMTDVNENIKISLAEKNNIRNIETAAVKRGMIVPAQEQVQYVSVKPLTPTEDKYSPSAFQMMQRLLGLIY